MKRSIKVIIGFIGFLIVLGTIASIPMQSSSQKTTQENDIGKTYVHNDLSITLNSAKRQSFFIHEYGGKMEAPEGREYLIVNMIAINKGHKGRYVDWGPFVLVDEYGNKFNSFYNAGHGPFRELYYNEKSEAALIYEIPKNSGKLVLKHYIYKENKYKYDYKWRI